MKKSEKKTHRRGKREEGASANKIDWTYLVIPRDYKENYGKCNADYVVRYKMNTIK